MSYKLLQSYLLGLDVYVVHFGSGFGTHLLIMDVFADLFRILVCWVSPSVTTLCLNSE